VVAFTEQVQNIEKSKA